MADTKSFAVFLPAWVATQSDLVALVGDRVGPWQSAQGEVLPRIVYHRISGGNVRSLTGPSGLSRERWQIDCYGATYSSAEAVARKIKGRKGDVRLDGYRGTLAGVVVRACLLEDDRDEPIPPADASDRATYCVSLDFSVSCDEVT